MARQGINKVIVVGNLGKDPEVRYMQSGGEVTNITLATSETWNDKSTGEKKEKTEWHRIVFYGKLAEIAGKYLSKGKKVYIEGRLQTNKWQDQNGADRYTTEIVASELQMLDPKGSDDSQQQFQSQQKTRSMKDLAEDNNYISTEVNEAAELEKDIPF